MRNLEFCDSPRLGAMEQNSIPHGMTKKNKIKSARHDSEKKKTKKSLSRHKKTSPQNIV